MSWGNVRTAAARILAFFPTSNAAGSSYDTRTASSAPFASASRSIGSVRFGPRVRATTRPPCVSFSRTAASRAYSSAPFTLTFTPSRRMSFPSGATWNWRSGFGTCFMHTTRFRGTAGAGASDDTSRFSNGRREEPNDFGTSIRPRRVPRTHEDGRGVRGGRGGADGDRRCRRGARPGGSAEDPVPAPCVRGGGPRGRHPGTACGGSWNVRHRGGRLLGGGVTRATAGGRPVAGVGLT